MMSKMDEIEAAKDGD